MLKEKMKGFFAGVVTAAVLICGYSAFSETIDKVLTATFKDIQINISGEPIVPKDSNGKIVEPFVVDGTTYLPVRAISEALGYEVDWDAETNTVLIYSGYDQGYDEDQGTYDFFEMDDDLYLNSEHDEDVYFEDLFTNAGDEFLVNFDLHDDDPKTNVTLLFDLIGYPDEEYPALVRLNIVAYTKDGEEGVLVLENYVSAVCGDSIYVYNDESDGALHLQLNAAGYITVNSLGGFDLGSPVRLDGDYLMAGLG